MVQEHPWLRCHSENLKDKVFVSLKEGDFLVFLLLYPVLPPTLFLFLQTSVLFLVVVKSFICLVLCVCLSPCLPVNTGSPSLAWLQNIHVNSDEQGRNLAVSLFFRRWFSNIQKERTCVSL